MAWLALQTTSLSAGWTLAGVRIEFQQARSDVSIERFVALYLSFTSFAKRGYASCAGCAKDVPNFRTCLNRVQRPCFRAHGVQVWIFKTWFLLFHFLRALCWKKGENICILCIQANQMSHIVLANPASDLGGSGGGADPLYYCTFFATMTSHWVGGWRSMHFSCLLR